MGVICLRQTTASLPRIQKERGFQEEEFVSDFASPQPPPENPETAARRRVDGHIAANTFVINNPPSAEAYDEAVAAEMREVGSGSAILSRAANDTWRARRST